jgi:hypothetical protein
MSELSSSEISALHEALDDEHQAWATYDQVIADFGEVMPFMNIRDAEARHIEALSVLFRAYGLAIPENAWPGRVPRFGSVREACEAGIAAEVANAALYERLLSATHGHPDRIPAPAGSIAAAPLAGLPALSRTGRRRRRTRASTSPSRGTPMSTLAEKGAEAFRVYSLWRQSRTIPNRGGLTENKCPGTWIMRTRPGVAGGIYQFVDVKPREATPPDLGRTSRHISAGFPITSKRQRLAFEARPDSPGRRRKRR